jgi:predicted PurR-regulated permease PerM
MSEPAASDPFIRRLKSAVAIGALSLGMLFLLWAVSHLLLMLFAAILGALFLDGNIGTPVVQQRAVSIPLVKLLVAQVGMGILFGIAGMVLATPITVVAIVMVQMLYLQDVLHEPVRILGQHDSRG